MTLYKVYSAALMMAALLSCSHPRAVRDAGAPSVYRSAQIRQEAAADYEGAMRLAEEGMRKGQLSAFEAYELQASLTYQYTENYQKAASLLRKAMEQDEAQDPSARTQLLYHLATILTAGRDFTACLAACTEGKELAHAIGHVYEAHSFDFIAGSCLFAIGEDEAGLTLMKDAIAGASAVAGSKEEYGHLIYFTSNLVNSYTELKDYAAAIEECAVNESLLSRMEERYPETDSSYLDRSRFYLNLSLAICHAGLGDGANAARRFEDAMKSDFASTESGKLRIVDYYAVIGDPERLLGVYDEIPYTDADTVSRLYRLRIARLRDAYTRAGKMEEAARLNERYDCLSALLEEKEAAEGIRVRSAQYEAQHYRLSLGDALTLLKKYKCGITLLILLFATAFVAFMLMNHWMSRRKEARLQKDAETLEKNLRSLQKQVSLIAERELYSADSDDSGRKNASLVQLIERRKLYLNKNLNRESAASLLGVSQAEITKALSEIESGLSFPDYIKGLRIRHALKLLGKNPDTPIAELADRCGFYSTRTLQRSFLALTGKTPSEYAKDLKHQAN